MSFWSDKTAAIEASTIISLAPVASRFLSPQLNLSPTTRPIIHEGSWLGIESIEN